MRLARALIWLGAILLTADAVTLARADGLPEPICWRQSAFSIPFTVGPAEGPDKQPREVRLYVSTNQGAKWDLVQSVAPQSSSFVFRAPSDGEFWFIVRTVDATGRVVPQEGGPPELRVVVDTSAPRLELTATRGESGEIKTQWRAVDPLLNADSLKIEYQSTGGQWRSVAIDRPRGAPGDRSTTTGTLTWWPNDAPAAVAVRAEISDRAGNVAMSQATAQAAAKSRDDLTARAGQQQSPFIESSNSSTGPIQSPFQSFATQPSGTPWPADRSDEPLGRERAPAPSPSQTSGAPQTSFVAQRPDWPQSSGAPTEWNQSRTDPGPSRSNIVEGINPPIRNEAPAAQPPRRGPERSAHDPNAAPAVSTVDPRTAAGQSQAFAGQRPRMVNSKSFEMDYEVDSVGNAGIAKVELWGTRDGGRTWSSFGTDNDNRSPIRATVDGEGVYGFRITVQSGDGLGGTPPREGDQPEVNVEVDLSQPTVQLVSAEGGSDERAGELVIRWTAKDNALAVRPITLLFSDRRGGPWSIIAGGLENTGRYAWRPDNRVPDQIYLRIEARDEAGNTAFFEATDPVSVARIRPEGRIRGVRPLNDSALRPQMYQFFR